MRVICTIDNERDARRFVEYLTKMNIANKLEVNTNTDWGSSDYGLVTCQIWVIDEDQVEDALKYYDEFIRDPNNPRYLPEKNDVKIFFDPFQMQGKAASAATNEPAAKIQLARAGIIQPSGKITIYLLLACCLILLISAMTTPKVVPPFPDLPLTALLSSPIKKAFFYDYPKAFEIVDKLVSLFGAESLQNISELPPEGKFLLNEFHNTPYWHGFYDKIVAFFQGNEGELWTVNAPMFEKIRQGEFWRVVTPTFLHADLFHLLFNMVWLYVIGKQIEQRIGGTRYLLMIFIAAVLSNTAQYLMTGPSFLGFSGVLCAMLSFIWMRQQKAAWEGYQLQRSTWMFILFFIFTMVGIQFLSFLAEIYAHVDLGVGIANTAHLMGFASGFLMGTLNFFAAKR